MKKTLMGVVAFAFLFVAAPALAVENADSHAESKKETAVAIKAEFKKADGSYDREALITRIKELITQLQQLRGEMLQVQKEIRATLSDSLKEGMENEEIRQIQKLLATDPDIYPEGLTTGYYGRLTAEALKRFQVKHNLTVTGEVDAETKALLEAYLAEKFGSEIPAGLLKVPGIQKKVVENLCESEVKAKSVLCGKKDISEKQPEKDFQAQITVTVEDDVAAIHVRYGKADNEQYTVTRDFTDEEDIFEYLIEHKNYDREFLEDVVEFEYEDEESN